MRPILFIVVPCYNEEEVLPESSRLFFDKLVALIDKNEIAPESRVLFVDDGSRDSTWKIIQSLSREDEHFQGVSLSRNRGHQNALLAGLLEAKDKCDITISIDCDGQDDIDAIDEMVARYKEGNDVVYGVRSDRSSDSFFKRFTAESYYHILRFLGADIVFNHADYRLLSDRVLYELDSFKEVNLYLRGIIPLIGFSSTSVYYSRKERIAGETHYPLARMLALAMNGITSLSAEPLRLISKIGVFIAIISFIGVIWSIVEQFTGNTVAGWASMTCIICFVAGVQLLSIGILGEYIGKIYLEVKGRPRFIIKERTKRYEEQAK